MFSIFSYPNRVNLSLYAITTSSIFPFIALLSHIILSIYNLVPILCLLLSHVSDIYLSYILSVSPNLPSALHLILYNNISSFFLSFLLNPFSLKYFDKLYIVCCPIFIVSISLLSAILYNVG